jgi:enoyl-CoA hydratase/carnithine racemase
MPLTFADAALKLHFDGPTAVLSLDRPQRTNPINAAVWADLPAALQAAADHAPARVLVLRGSGAHFAAGADISEFGTHFADRAAAAAYARLMAQALDALVTCPLPTLALIRGHCIGAGVALALACDLRLASADAGFAVTPARLGLMYPLADTRRLAACVGVSAAKDMLFTGRRLGADEALRLGLVDALHADAELDAAVAAKAAQIGAASAWSVRRAKEVLGLISDGQTEDNDQTRAWFAEAAEQADFAEGLQAFHQKRAARFGPR